MNIFPAFEEAVDGANRDTASVCVHRRLQKETFTQKRGPQQDHRLDSGYSAINLNSPFKIFNFYKKVVK